MIVHPFTSSLHTLHRLPRFSRAANGATHSSHREFVFLVRDGDSRWDFRRSSSRSSDGSSSGRRSHAEYPNIFEAEGIAGRRRRYCDGPQRGAAAGRRTTSFSLASIAVSSSSSIILRLLRARLLSHDAISGRRRFSVGRRHRIRIFRNVVQRDHRRQAESRASSAAAATSSVSSAAACR